MPKIYYKYLYKVERFIRHKIESYERNLIDIFKNSKIK